jgi:hypothetical protein
MMENYQGGNNHFLDPLNPFLIKEGINLNDPISSIEHPASA